VGGPHKNPEGRIADDVRIATEAPIEFTTGVTTAVLSAVTFGNGASSATRAKSRHSVKKRGCGERMRRCTDRSRQARAPPRPRPHFGRSQAN